MRVPKDTPEWLPELFARMNDDIEESLFAAREAPEVAHQAARLSTMREFQREVELLADVEQEAEKREVLEVFNAERAS